MWNLGLYTVKCLLIKIILYIGNLAYNNELNIISL